MDIIGVCLTCLPQSGSAGITIATAVAMLAIAIYRSASIAKDTKAELVCERLGHLRR